MTDKVSHEEAVQIALAYIDKAFNNPEKPGRRIRHSIPANPREDTDIRLMAYIKQQTALEADTVSRAEHEAALNDLRDIAESTRGDWTSRTEIGSKAMLHVSKLMDDIAAATEQQAEYERVVAELKASLESCHSEALSDNAKLSFERARAEEAKRQLAAANARAGRLEEAVGAERTLRFAIEQRLCAAQDLARGVLRMEWPSSRPDSWRIFSEALLEPIQLSTAPQASMEQAAPSPAVGEPDAEALQMAFEGYCNDYLDGDYSGEASERLWELLRFASGQLACPIQEPAQPALSVEAGRVQTSPFRQVAEASVQPAPGGTERCVRCGGQKHDGECECECLPGWKALNREGEHNPRCPRHPSAEPGYYNRLVPTPAEPQGRPEQADGLCTCGGADTHDAGCAVFGGRALGSLLLRNVDQLRADIVEALRGRGIHDLTEAADELERKAGK